MALSDPTRLRIINEIILAGRLTAADLGRKLNKKIPSILHQLEILKKANIVIDEMIFVDTIGREIKHWFVPQERLVTILDISLPALARNSIKPYSQRIAVINAYRMLSKSKSPLSMKDIKTMLKNIESLSNGAIKLNEITELDLFDALAIEVYGRFRYADPPEVEANLFLEINNLTPEVAEAILANLKLNQRIEEINRDGYVYFRFV